MPNICWRLYCCRNMLQIFEEKINGWEEEGDGREGFLTDCY